MPVAILVSLVTAVVLAAPVLVEAQATREWITESAVSVGRPGANRPSDSFFAGVLLLGDVGLRWVGDSGRSFGVSIASGYDVPNEGFLMGVRPRVGVELSRGSRLEGSVALLGSSAGAGGFGASLAAAYYPRPSGAVVGQVDILPTTIEDFGFVDDPPTQEESTKRDPSMSAGVRLAGRGGLYSWALVGAWGLLALAFIQ